MVKLDCTGVDCLVQVRDLDKKYHRGAETIDVLRGLNLDVSKGEFVAFMGPSGSGKTTLLNLIGGLDTPTDGTIEIAGERIDAVTGGEYLPRGTAVEVEKVEGNRIVVRRADPSA